MFFDHLRSSSSSTSSSSSSPSPTGRYSPCSDLSCSSSLPPKNLRTQSSSAVAVVPKNSTLLSATVQNSRFRSCVCFFHLSEMDKRYRSGRQQALFRKYRADREKAIKEMVQNLEDLKEDFE